MIFVAAGTQDGREIIGLLLQQGYAVTASVISYYGEKLLAQYASYGEKLVINDQALDAKGLAEYFHAHHVNLLVDASHPYAVNVSQNAMAACKAQHIPYIRYERDLTQLAYEKIIVVHSYEEACEQAAKCGEHIFLTTGSRNLQKFTTSSYLQGKNLIARVLPTAEVIALCEQLGLLPGQIIGMQGPFSQMLNQELFAKYHADVIVTKNSGSIGGTDTKIAAAQAMGLPVIVIDRPKLHYDRLARTYEEVLTFVKEHS